MDSFVGALTLDSNFDITKVIKILIKFLEPLIKISFDNKVYEKNIFYKLFLNLKNEGRDINFCKIL